MKAEENKETAAGIKNVKKLLESIADETENRLESQEAAKGEMKEGDMNGK